MVNVFSHELRERIKHYLGRYETQRSAILPILHAIQDEKDWISKDDVAALEKDFALPAVWVEEVLCFYTMYRKAPPKPFRFEVCHSLPCWLMKSQGVYEAVKKRIERAEREGRELPFEVHKVECMGLCGWAPVAYVNKERHLNLTPEKAIELIDEYSRGELPPAAKRCQELTQGHGG